jgi:hypothetical protein
VHSAIEQTFGFAKKRFPIIKTTHCLGYSFTMQRKVMFCFLIHNLIRVNQGK